MQTATGDVSTMAACALRVRFAKTVEPRLYKISACSTLTTVSSSDSSQVALSLFFFAETVPANQSDCPYSYYRTSGDIKASYTSTMENLQTVIKFVDKNLSFPGCFAFPDALEVWVV